MRTARPAPRRAPGRGRRRGPAPSPGRSRRRRGDPPLTRVERHRSGHLPGRSPRARPGGARMSDPVQFAVWAPLPSRVRLQVDGAVHEMTRDDDGWWRAEIEAGPEADYGFLLDDNETPRPDPRSRPQPDGVHGLSRRFDPGAYTWRDTAWTGRPLAGGVVYELHVGTFTPEGTLDSAVERLDHLVELGVDFVELLPVNGFNGTHNWGYDGVLWYTVQETYGGPAAYQRFVDACHERGLGVIQDVVYNHLGPSGNYLPEFFPIFAERANTWGQSVNLSGPDSDEVRRYVIDNAL